MLKQHINVFIAMAMVASVGIGAAYLIIQFASATDFSYVSTDESITISAEIRRDAEE